MAIRVSLVGSVPPELVMDRVLDTMNSVRTQCGGCLLGLEADTRSHRICRAALASRPSSSTSCFVWYYEKS
jgi:hypothetical protein